MSCDYLNVLELAMQNRWDEAHEIVQNYGDQWACLIHGYLHRVEGDLSNARYWYERANVEMPDNSLDEEWKRLFDLVSAANSDFNY